MDEERLGSAPDGEAEGGHGEPAPGAGTGCGPDEADDPRRAHQENLARLHGIAMPEPRRPGVVPMVGYLAVAALLLIAFFLTAMALIGR